MSGGGRVGREWGVGRGLALGGRRCINAPQLQHPIETTHPHPHPHPHTPKHSHDFIPDSIHAGGLRYHGMSPLISHVLDLGLIEARAIPQSDCFDAALKVGRGWVGGCGGGPGRS